MLHAHTGPFADPDVKAHLEAVAANWADPMPRLTLADRLDEMDLTERAVLIRYGVSPKDYPIPLDMRTCPAAAVDALGRDWKADKIPSPFGHMARLIDYLLRHPNRELLVEFRVRERAYVISGPAWAVETETDVAAGCTRTVPTASVAVVGGFVVGASAGLPERGVPDLAAAWSAVTATEPVIASGWYATKPPCDLPPRSPAQWAAMFARAAARPPDAMIAALPPPARYRLRRGRLVREAV